MRMTQQTNVESLRPLTKTEREISKKLRRNFLVFRAYEDPITIRPYQPKDNGYYFLLHNCNITIIRFTLEDNGFRDIK